MVWPLSILRSGAMLALLVTAGLLSSLAATGGGSQRRVERQRPSPTAIDVLPATQTADVRRLGLNVGAQNPFGAAQHLKNVITNPGFEAGEFAMILLTAAGATESRWQHDSWDTNWNNDPLSIGQPEGFWDGADYEILTGPAAGESGTIAAFTHEDDRYTFYPAVAGTAPNTGDVVVVRRAMPGFHGDTGAYNAAEPAETRPGSPGSQALRLSPATPWWQPSYAYYMDSFYRDADPTAGKLMLIDGSWHFEVWARAETVSDTLEIFFHRENQALFFSQVFTLTTSWEKLEVDFTVPIGLDAAGDFPSVLADRYVSPYPERRGYLGSSPILELGLRVGGSGGDILVDDIQLAKLSSNPTAFTDNYVAKLLELQPGLLRNWGNQLASSLDNQTAVATARKSTGHAPRRRYALNNHFSLPDFLHLARHVGADPWYVIPPSFTITEVENLIAYLAAPAGAHPYADLRAAQGQLQPWTTIFDQIHLEYGNETWGSNAGDDPFWGATFRGGVRVGQVAGGRLAAMRASPFFNSADFNLIIGGQHGFPGTQSAIEANSSAHDAIALAPYFGTLNNYADDSEVYGPLFARPAQDTTTGNVAQSKALIDAAGQGTELAVYEINFHTTTGNAPLALRNDFVSGLSGGVALPLYMLTYLHDYGIRDQAAFGSLQYSFRMNNGEYVRLWGMLRDIEATGRKRPTWLGLEVANRAIRGDMIATAHSGADPTWIQPPINEITDPIEVPYIQSFAFRDGDSYAIILFNLHLTEAQLVTLNFPTLVDESATIHRLRSTNITDSNEEAQNVTITRQIVSNMHQSYALTLPVHSITVVEWDVLPPDQARLLYLPVLAKK